MDLISNDLSIYEQAFFSYLIINGKIIKGMCGCSKLKKKRDYCPNFLSGKDYSYLVKQVFNEDKPKFLSKKQGKKIKKYLKINKETTDFFKN